MKWNVCIGCFLILGNGIAQQTGGHIIGCISKNGYPIKSAYIMLSVNTHKEKYTSYSDTNGYYYFKHLDAIGTYTLKATTKTGDSTTINNIEIVVGETLQLNITLDEKKIILTDVLVKSSIPNRTHIFGVRKGTELAKGNGMYGGMFQQFPQIQMMQNGGLSIAQQNPRFNAIYIDGALQNDLFGLSATSIAGGQTLGFPIETKEIEQMQVLSSSFDASIGNFTGGAINITTKAGTNKAIQKYVVERGFGRIEQQRTGSQLSGAIIKNKIFYAGSIDYFKYEASEAFDLTRYRGNIQHLKQLALAANTIQSLYNYEIGMPECIDSRKHHKVSFRMDWLLNRNQKLTYTFRHFTYERIHNSSSNPYSLFLSDAAKRFSGTVVYGNIEYKKWWRNSSNRLLVSVYKNIDNTSSGQVSFPALKILDGEGMIYTGNQPDAMQNNIKQTQFFVYNKFQQEKNKWLYAMGMEIHHAKISNSYLPNSFGTYFYYALADFIQNKRPGSYERDIYTKEATLLAYTRAAIFLQSEKRFNNHWQAQAGMRITLEHITGSSTINEQFNKNILPAMATLYDIGNTQTGSAIHIIPAITPRVSFTYQDTEKGWWIHGGSGFFTGTIPLAWVSGGHLFNGIYNTIFRADNASLKQLRFNADPYTQWQPAQFADSFSIPTINLVSKSLKMPVVWKTALFIRKNFKQHVSIQTNFLCFINKEEIAVGNIALAHPTIQLSGPDQRLIYDSNRIMPGYHEVYLLKNNNKQAGYGYQLQIQLRKQINQSFFDLAYVWGDAFSLYDGNNTLLSNQWKLTESVEGRNNLVLARSDYSIGHAIQIRYYHEMKLGKQRLGFQLEYQGRAGMPFSYVYGEKSMVQDAVNTPGFDLIYVPTKADLEKQQFVPIVSGQYYYTAEFQKELLNIFIEGNKYLRSRRGSYAERNGSRHPFIHQCHLHISYDLPVKLYRNRLYVQSFISFFNIQSLFINAAHYASLLGRNKVKLINFQGYLNGNYTPSYSFDPNLLTDQGSFAMARVSPELDQFLYIKTGLSLSFY